MNFALVGRIVAAGMLLWALDEHPYSYFTLLRLVVCIVAAYCAMLANERHKDTWAWILGGIAVLFNPIIPFHLDRESWQLIDLVIAIVLLISLAAVRGSLGKKVSTHDKDSEAQEDDDA